MGELITQNDLHELAKQINANYVSSIEAAVTAIDLALATGDDLLKAKSMVEHGEWSSWVKKNIDFSERKAQMYMRLARERPALEGKSATVADLTLRGAMKLIGSAKNVGALRKSPKTPSPPSGPQSGDSEGWLQRYQDVCIDIKHAEEQQDLSAHDAFQIATRCTSTFNTVIDLVDRVERKSIFNKMVDIIERHDNNKDITGADQISQQEHEVDSRDSAA